MLAVSPYYMEHRKEMNFTAFGDLTATLKLAVRGYVSGSNETIILTDYTIQPEDLLSENQRNTFALELISLEEARESLHDTAAGIIALYDDGYTHEALNGLELFDLKADNLLLQLQLLALKMSSKKSTQHPDPEKDIFTETPFSSFAHEVEDINALYLEHAGNLSPDSVQKRLETLVEERTNELKKANQELENMNKELSSFAYISSHDLQEPLRKIQTFSSIIAVNDLNNLSEAGKKHFAKIQLSANRMTKLIQDLLTYSRSNTDDKTFEQTDLNIILAEVTADFAESLNEKNGTLTIGPMPVINAIPFQIRQLFNNLVSNALKFAKEDIPIVVTISSQTVKGNAINSTKANPDKDYLHIALTDNGIGFSPEYASRIFEVFERLHGKSEYEGTGIGLAICMKIAENHNAILNAWSQPGEGAIFNIYFPLN